MQSIGVFQAISDGYFAAGRQSFHYAGRVFPLLRLIFYPLAAFIWLCMAAGGIFFRLFIILDWLSAYVNNLRRRVLNTLRRLQNGIPNSFFAFLINPVLIVLLAPVFLLCTILPKFSSAVPGLAGESMEQFSTGVFRQMNRISWQSANNLFRYVANAPLVLKPVTGTLAIGLSIILIITGAAFFVLIVFDLISSLVERMRLSLVLLTQSLANGCGRSFFHFFVAPALMIVLAPVLVALLIIPKMSSGMDVA